MDSSASEGDRYDQLSDDAVLARIERGDERALLELYNRFGQLAYGLALRIVGDRPAAEQIVCDDFAQLWRWAPAGVAAIGTPKRQLLVAVHRRACDRARSDRAGRAAPGGVEQPSGPLPAVLREAGREEVALAYYGGYTCTEIAARLGIPVETVSSRIASAMNGVASLHVGSASAPGEAALEAVKTRPAPG